MSSHKRRVRLAADLYRFTSEDPDPALHMSPAACALMARVRPRHVLKEIARRAGEPWAPHADRGYRVPPARCDKRTLARIARERHEAERAAFLADLAKNGPPTFLPRR